MENMEAILGRLSSVVEERFESKTAFAEEWIEYEGEDFLPATVAAKLAGSQTMRLREILSMADFLSLDYRWLFSGSRDSWGSMEVETVIIGLGEYGVIEFKIPFGWNRLDLVFRPGRRPLALSSVRTQDDE